MWRKENSKDRNPLIAGYRIGDELGRGPLGTVYEATNVESGQRAVFRGFARPTRASQREWDAAMAQFTDLLDRHRALEPHPAIQKILDFGEEDGVFWIASEFFQATPLRKILDERGAQPFPWALQVLGQVANAVDFAAERGLPHTDLTPYNILVAQDPQNPAFLDVKIINFGLGHARQKRGTPYAAPEQQRGGEGDRRSDAWALGTLLCEIVSGKSLFSGKPNDVVKQVLGGKPGAPQQLPGTALAVLHALLAPEPDRRYQRLTDAVLDLDFGREPAFARLGKRTKSVRGAGTPLAIQKFSLGGMDVVDLRWKKLQKDLGEDAREERRRAVLGRIFQASLGLLTFSGLLYRASTLPETFSTATVSSISGAPNRSGSPLFAGQKISGRERSTIQTGPGESVVLTFRGGRLLLPENSSLEIGRLGWNEAPERRFRLNAGRVIVEPMKLPARSIFEVSVGSKRVFTRTGKLAMSANGQVAIVSGDAHEVTEEATTELKPSELPEWGKRGLAAMAKSGRPAGIAAAWLGSEESLLLPMWDGVRQIVRLPSAIADGKKTMTAQASLQGIAPLFQTATLGEGVPERIDPVTLVPLPIPESARRKLLRAFVGNRIDHYKKFASGGWQLEARAADALQTPLRLRNGKATQVPREERFTW